jgi:hypothetical protein
MGRTRTENMRLLLGRRVSEFLASESPYRRPLGPLVQEICRRGRCAYLFGGTLRDLMLHGPGATPRDLDIVVSELTPDLDGYLGPHLTKRTRFGGLQVSCGHWDLDIWALSQTWAFQQRLIAPGGFEDLPRTTFLNVQAVVVEAGDPCGRPRKVIERGFFQSLTERTLDVNFEENPFPAHCVLSALITAYRLDFVLAPRLIRYVLHYAGQTDFDELCGYQAQRYGRVLYGRDTLSSWIAHLVASHREALSMPVRLPRLRADQRAFPWAGEAAPHGLAIHDDPRENPDENREEGVSSVSVPGQFLLF